METATEEAAATPCLNTDLITKGKRTKRERPNSPVSFTITPPPRAAASSEESTTTEEADTARCLILLSRGHFNNNRRSDAATTSYGGGGACIYTCKTCNRSFSSFQALGGHRASHKKPRNEKRYAIFSDEEDLTSPSSSSRNKFSPTSLSLQLSSVSTTTTTAVKSPRVHECSYCGAEFASGQALGGHMRKHRGGAAPSPRGVDEVEAGKWLSLDLNLPAPEDERERSPNRIPPPLLLHP
ncbi:zinc finger protein ZAT5-like [Salvia miltiorrhiza]|uniref:zinc finger protein ZAT5-like n=1 Tax=Salvia miltiorrhiza TaxID=226208 RepID=UPI0025AD0CE9|nr:zinc finger protein ZAT5-like [Salvia miltiorrhiza]